ncbi:MAG: DNA-processing protein DprA [Lysobacterales bacterium]
MTLAETAAWLIWLRAPEVGPVRLGRALARFGSMAAALEAGPSGWRDLGAGAAAVAWLTAPDRTRIEADLRWLEAPGRSLLTAASSEYPALLARTAQAPAALFVAGNAALLWNPQIAIVGSRQASAGGLGNARAFARDLAQAGFTITSGLAAGIDGAAHAAALAAGGASVAVLGSGLDRIYPRSHQALAGRLCECGALVSEFPPGTPPLAENFPRRNRIIAGLSLATLVVEAGLQSGSLITARLAAEAGREVFAIPGSIHNPMARGCHRLLREGAGLVETVADVLDNLAPLARELGTEISAQLQAAPASAPKLDPEQQRLWQALGHDPVGFDLLLERSGLTAAAISSMLIALELDGVVAALPGNRYQRVDS